MVLGTASAPCSFDVSAKAIPDHSERVHPDILWQIHIFHHKWLCDFGDVYHYNARLAGCFQIEIFFRAPLLEMDPAHHRSVHR